MIKRDLRTNEFYISPLYNLLVEDGKKIRTEDVDKMHVFGTPDGFTFTKTTLLVVWVINRIYSDHSGFDAKETFKKVLEDNGYEYVDFGTILNKDCDYRITLHKQ